MLNEVLTLELNNLREEVLVQVVLSHCAEKLPVFAFEDDLLVQADLVDAEGAQVMGVVSLGYKVNWEDIMVVDKIFDVLWGDLYHPVYHEVISIN